MQYFQIESDIGLLRHPGDRLLCLRRDSLTPPRRDTPPRDKTDTATPPRRAQEPLAMSEGTASKQSTPDIKLEFWDISELSPLSTPATSPPRTPSPFDLTLDKSLGVGAGCVGSRTPSPKPGLHSPVPRDSPLLSPYVENPVLKRARSFNKVSDN